MIFEACENASICPFPNTVTAVAMSAGGIDAIGQLLAGLPIDFAGAIVVQTHQNRCGVSILDKILMRRARIPVGWARHGQHLTSGSVVIAPPGQHLTIAPCGLLNLTDSGPAHMNPSADYLFASIAGSFTSRAVGVVLSGFLNDGARGIRLIHELGGRTLVQSPATAVAPDMPNAAIATGCVEFVVPLEGLSSALMGIVGQN